MRGILLFICHLLYSLTWPTSPLLHYWKDYSRRLQGIWTALLTTLLQTFYGFLHIYITQYHAQKSRGFYCARPFGAQEFCQDCSALRVGIQSNKTFQNHLQPNLLFRVLNNLSSAVQCTVHMLRVSLLLLAQQLTSWRSDTLCFLQNKLPDISVSNKKS